MSNPFFRAFSSCSKTCCALSTPVGSPSSFTHPSRVVTFTPSVSSSVFNSFKSFAYRDCKTRGLSNCKVRVLVIVQGEAVFGPRSRLGSRLSLLPRSTLRLTETVHQCPVCTFLWRLLDTDNDKIAAGSFGNDVGSRRMALVPSVGLFCQLPIRVINVNGYLRPIDLRSQPKPVFVPFEKLLAHRLFLLGTEVASPEILTHLKSFLHVRFRSLKCK